MRKDTKEPGTFLIESIFSSQKCSQFLVRRKKKVYYKARKRFDKGEEAYENCRFVGRIEYRAGCIL